MDHFLLSNIPLFASLEKEECVSLAKKLKIKTYKAQEMIFWIGEIGDKMYILQQGKVQIFIPDENGKNVTIAELEPGMFFGELSLLDGGTRTASAQAILPTTLFILDRNSFFEFLEQHPAAVRHVFSTIASRQREGLSKLRGIANINEQEEESLTPMQKIVDKATTIGASITFLAATMTFIIIWMAIHTYLYWQQQTNEIKLLDTPPTFFWLGFLICLTSFLLTIFVLNSQRRQAQRDRIRAEIEYQVNVKAHSEVMSLHQKIDTLQAMLRSQLEKNINASSEF
ncbi:MAG: cyclic nucleotide-binding domain-containing protein [Bacteroidota bacterium]|nr:cyclic nucleotide-binding domain-containing protein [Bacteroidota bacterium]